MVLRIARAATLDCGSFSLVDLGRVKTSHQRADRVAFADSGRLLAVTCPRYDRLMIYRVTESPALEPARDVELGGQPVAVCAARDRFLVLTRPTGDLRHVQKGSIRSIGFDGRPLAAPIEVGFYPDDLAIGPDGRFAFAICSGRAEGEPDRPLPSFATVDLAEGRVVASVEFGGSKDDPWRVSLSTTGQAAAVTLRGSDVVAAVDLSDPRAPRLIGRTPLSAREVPYPSIDGPDWLMMPVANDREAVLMPSPGTDGPFDPVRGLVVSTLPDDSGLDVVEVASGTKLGRLPLRGTANLGEVRPMGIAGSPDRGLLAVATRSGSVHLVAIRTKGAPSR